MSKELLEGIFNAAFVKTPSLKKSLTEATMNDIPHEIDDVVHCLKQLRFDMEELHKTWEQAQMNLAPLDNIILGLNSLIKTVYSEGAKLADQQVGVDQRESALKEVEVKEDSDNLNQDMTQDLPESEENNQEDDWKLVEMVEVMDMLDVPENAYLKKAFKRGAKAVREHRPVGTTGEITKVFVSPIGNMKLEFDGMEKPIFVYKDGGISGEAWRSLK